MKNPVFQFKKFEIKHEINGQKVSTDSVLLGAWANFSNSKIIVDIGTGCGILALMAAQRTNEDVRVYAIEKEKSFYEEADLNFKKSIYYSKIKSIHTNILNWDEIKADYLICNPPYFSNALLSPDKNRSNARHNLDLSIENLVKTAKRILIENGIFSFVVPQSNYANFKNRLVEEGFFEKRTCHVRHTKTADVSIILAEYSLENLSETNPELFIKDNDDYTDAYRTLLKDFLTIF